MPPDFFADPDAMEAAVDAATQAADELRAATGHLDVAYDAVAATAHWAIGFGPGLRHKTETMTRQWREEFGHIADLMISYETLIRAITEAYRNRETGLAAELDRHLVDTLGAEAC